ncbi:MAG: leucyl/phenylalanyl-tRNA--protein transferase [Gammaproteobacteria bacterium]|nr:leucyl/phenylalanyl-tRNA--protein transferase [Gammaproteobacteria bacterium]MBU1654982.1 leucyl/phenylalanyl-tRNA--protein transferase [Gammaproteobacteria bacterium]MBU1962334.1 leucyl/phenylalanyl-tRNA--protein transferase [Gammaproteobacteria bacterium]
MLSLLDPNDPSRFPDPDEAELYPNGLLAVGGDLRPERLLSAYRRGIFPWYNADQPILWWSPDPRSVLFPERLHISRSLARRLRRCGFEILFDQDFEAVMDACAAPRDHQPGTWITTDMRRAYIELHHLGHAHSVEVRGGGELLGGLYGVSLGRVFFGESMFSRVDDASKIALTGLVHHLREWGYRFIDCQVRTDHLVSLGAEEIPRMEFNRLLDHHCPEPGLEGTWRQVPPLPAKALA